SDGVRLMTVHKAKGLEFPVVVLVDIGADLSRSTASRWVDTAGRRCAVNLAGWAPAELRQPEALEVARDEAEGGRVPYGGATRARAQTSGVTSGDPSSSGVTPDVDPAGDVRVEAIPRPPGIAAAGARFGALVHAVLALVPLDAGPAAVDAIAAQQAIVLGADAA